MKKKSNFTEVALLFKTKKLIEFYLEQDTLLFEINNVKFRYYVYRIFLINLLIFFPLW